MGASSRRRGPSSRGSFVSCGGARDRSATSAAHRSKTTNNGRPGAPVRAERRPVGRLREVRGAARGCCAERAQPPPVNASARLRRESGSGASTPAPPPRWIVRGVSAFVSGGLWIVFGWAVFGGWEARSETVSLSVLWASLMCVFVRSRLHWYFFFGLCYLFELFNSLHSYL